MPTHFFITAKSGSIPGFAVNPKKYFMGHCLATAIVGWGGLACGGEARLDW